MARRKSGASTAGWAFLILVGGVVWVVGATYRFVVENQAAIISILVLAGIVSLVVWGLSRKDRKEANIPVTITLTTKVEPSFGFQSTGRAMRADARWIGAGESVNVQAFNINAGLFYLGSGVANRDGGVISQYVVNPKLPVHSSESDVTCATMPYWPSYASITPQARRAFLTWMATGRADPSYGIGHVFLFFYGLEHKQFMETGPDAARVTIPEVERLLSIYGGNNSFRGYASNFLVYARLASGLPLAPPVLTPERSGTPEVSPAVRVYLGEKLSKADVLSADDMLLWTLALPDTYLRTPAIRCFDEFVALWRLRFAEKFGPGFQVKLPAKKLAFTYRAASNAFTAAVAGPHTQYPDVAAVRQSLGGLQKLAQACTDELESFSRLVGKRPEKRTSVEAALLLPEALQRNASQGPLQEAAQRMTAIMGARNTATTKLRDVLTAAALEFSEVGKLPQTTGDQLGRILDRLDIAIEPDRRYGGGGAQIDDPVVIFRFEKGGAIDPTKPLYQKVKMQVEVSALAASADGSSTVDELQTIIANIKAIPDLSRIELLRLIAYAVTIFKSPPKLERIMRRLKECGESERQAIAAAAVSIVGKADNVDPQQVRFLERLNKALGLSKDKVYTDLHRANAAADEPVVVAPEDRAPGVPIPKQPPKPIQPPKSGIYIDQAKLAAVQKQTQAVSAILTQIFVDDAPGEPAAAPPPATNGSPFDGLDGGYAELVEYLEIKGEITRQEFEERAKALKLLPDGAIEKINDWSFDRFDGPLLEDGEHVILSPELRGRLAELRASGS